MTYEQYIRDPRFKVFGVGYQIDDGDKEYLSNEQHPGIVDEFIHDIFTPENDHTMVAHNAHFDGAILSWYYGAQAKTYWCTQAMSRALWNQRSASLKQLCISCYPEDDWQTVGITQLSPGSNSPLSWQLSKAPQTSAQSRLN